MFKPERKSIPNNPGVYIYKDKQDDIIYIGKAKNLRNRVSSYFSQDHKTSPKTRFLVKNIQNAEYIITSNEIEALLLENKLIKKHKPKYNIFLKDSKTYAYIKITDDEIPQLQITRKVTKGGDYFGPFTDGNLRNELFNLTVKIFKLVTRKTYSTKSKLNYEIGIAPAPSLNEIDRNKYLKTIEEAKDFLNRKNTKQTIKRLTNEMHLAKDNNKFEEALEKKKQIEAIEHLEERQLIDLQKDYDQDVLVKIDDKNKALFSLFNISKGVISGKKDYTFDNDDEIFESFLKMYYSSNYVPKEIIINIELEENRLLEEYLTKLRGSKVTLTYPKKGEKLALVNLAINNAKLNIGKENVLEQIKDKLNLPRLPITIECFDMSNLGKDYLVGAMTRWVNQKPDTNNYRKFEIKSFKNKNDDYAAMREVVYRRYRGIKEKSEKVDFPDLILIDGGKGQLHSALESLNKLNLTIPIISIAKGSNRDKNEIYLIDKDEPLIFDNDSKMMLYLRQIRDSVHNYVISYNRQKRNMKFKGEIKIL